MNADLDLSPLTRRLGHAEMLAASPQAWAALGGSPKDGPRVSSTSAFAEGRVRALLEALARCRAQGQDPASLRMELPGSTASGTTGFVLASTHLGHCAAWRLELAEC